MPVTVHQFNPRHYFNTLGSHEPVLVIQPGDSVQTTTVDARGVDQHGQQVVTGPNPMTGPFYIEGAQPGDTLQITIQKLQPNRATGWTRNVIAGNVLDPEYLVQLPRRDATNELAVWEVSADRNMARVSPEHMPDCPWIPLAPMIGCLGIAPAGGEAISTATSGVHGGNMDYTGIREGTTLLFRVAVPGALFFLGDVHAAQGDGEIVGTGIEISSDVQFRAELGPDWSVHWPRGMDQDFLFTAGNARPLDQATQHATTEMSRWLCEDLGMDLIRAHLMMGQCVRYDLGNIYDPAYTMICKMARTDLAAWGVKTT